MDRWLLARLNQLVTTARDRLSTYDARGFTQEVELFLDDLSNWYVRRARRRFWGTARGVAGDDKDAAYATLYTTLVTLARLLAPVLPFLSEVLYQNLVAEQDASAPESVHLAGYPVADQRATTNDQGISTDGHRSSLGVGRSSEGVRLLSEMEVVRRVVRLGRVARKSSGLRVRQPLARMLVAVGSADERDALLRLQDELLDELNVKALEVLDGTAALVRYRVKPNLRLLGPRLGRALPALRVALDALTPEAAATIARAVMGDAPVTLSLSEMEVTLAPAELIVESLPLDGYAVAQDAGTQVALDTMLTEALRREGQARDLVRAVQEVRKAAGLALSDRITLYLDSAGDVAAVLDEWRDYVQAETLAEALALGAPAAGAYAETVDLGGTAVTVGVTRR